ncbi:uncharacterized protein [Diabrotica undecimpunctata]|uniref:uncharacterized protein n=1 Tax=Diabrotica undecimpunctata TaxID=50387 RepID=UPI003B63EB0B
MIIDEHEIRTTWCNYISELYNDDRPEELETLVEGEGPEILKSEILHAIKLAKNKKAVGPNNIPTEMLKLINEKNIGILVKLFNDVYSNGDIPEDWLKSEFITVPKSNVRKTVAIIE